jgi:hypothetical protein
MGDFWRTAGATFKSARAAKIFTPASTGNCAEDSRFDHNLTAMVRGFLVAATAKAFWSAAISPPLLDGWGSDGDRAGPA